MSQPRQERTIVTVTASKPSTPKKFQRSSSFPLSFQENKLRQRDECPNFIKKKLILSIKKPRKLKGKLWRGDSDEEAVRGTSRRGETKRNEVLRGRRKEEQ